MIKLTAKETEFIRSEKVGRVSTVSEHGWPQTTPVLYSFHKGLIYFATDFGTKKLQHLKVNKRISIVIDVYGRRVHGITFQGTADILGNGDEFTEAMRLLNTDHDYYKKNPIKGGEDVIIRISPTRKASWGL